MDRIISPFGMLGPKYRTDRLGVALSYAGYLPAAAIVVLQFLFGGSPQARLEHMIVWPVALFVLFVLTIALLRRSERV